MKKIIKKLDALTAVLEERILDRNEVFDNRSQKWQESEKGEKYQERTDMLQEMYDEVYDWAMQLGEDE